MLSELSIRDLVIVESVDVSFVAGLNVLTGETGSGKSILIKADRSLPYEDVRKVMDILGENHQTSLMIAANKE